MENKSLIIFADNRQIVIPISPTDKVLSLCLASEGQLCNTLDISVSQMKHIYLHIKKIK